MSNQSTSKAVPARDVLQKAAKAVHDGTGKHGDTERSFAMIGQLWQTYIVHAWMQRQNNIITAQDVAQMMVFVKMARAVYGHSADNHVDMAGYAALASTLNPINSLDKDIADAIGSNNGREEKHVVSGEGSARPS